MPTEMYPRWDCEGLSRQQKYNFGESGSGDHANRNEPPT